MLSEAERLCKLLDHARERSDETLAAEDQVVDVLARIQSGIAAIAFLLLERDQDLRHDWSDYIR